MYYEKEALIFIFFYFANLPYNNICKNCNPLLFAPTPSPFPNYSHPPLAPHFPNYLVRESI